jgi:hypothetical protein
VGLGDIQIKQLDLPRSCRCELCFLFFGRKEWRAYFFKLLQIYHIIIVRYMKKSLRRTPQSDNLKRITLMDLLFHDVRRELISLSAIDHYIGATINAGKQMVLKYFSGVLRAISQRMVLKVPQNQS